MRYRRLRILVFATLLATAFTLHCLPTEAQSQDRRRSTTFLAASSQDSWPEWDGVTAHPELTDAHPTTGWPTEFGRICVTFSSGAAGEHRAIIDGRTDGDDPRPYLSVVNDGRIRFGIQTVGSIAGGEIIPFHTHTACVERSYGPLTTLTLDGVEIGTSTTLPAWDWHETVRLGSRYGGADPLGGTIASIQWRGFRMACDLRSDTCSDGRQIATTRPTPVPCEVSPGVWEMVPEDTACISWRGLDSWAQNTSYLSYGAELDRSPWRAVEGATVQSLPTGGYRVTGTASNSRALQGGISSIPGPHTLSCVLRTDEPGTHTRLRIWWGTGPIIPVPVTSTWATYSITQTVSEDAPENTSAHVYSGASTVDVIGCWLTRTDTPGRACWGGEAPVTCAADRHTISTEGWPVVAGEVSVIYTPGAIDDETKYLVSASTFSLVGWEVYVRFGSALAFLSHADGSARIVESDPLTWEARPYHIRVRWRAGEIVFWRDGVEVGRTSLSQVPAGPLPSTASIGLRLSGASGWIDGAISSLRVRSFE